MMTPWLKNRLLLACALGLTVAAGAEAAGSGDLPKDEPLPPGARARLGSPRLVHPPVKTSGTSRIYQSLLFSSDAQQLVTSTSNGQVRFWDVKTGCQLLRIDPPTDTVPDLVWPYSTGIALTADGKLLGLRVRNKGVVLYDARTGKDIRTITIPSEQNLAGFLSSDGFLSFSPDSKHMVATSRNPDDRSIRLFETDSGKEVRKFEGHDQPVRSAAFSADGKKLVSGSGDQSVRLWDVETGKLIQTFDGHRAAVQWVAISPDSKRIASLSEDGTVRIWDVDNGGNIRLPFDSYSGYALAGGTGSNMNTILRFSADGKILTGLLPTGVYQWDAVSGKLQREPDDPQTLTYRIFTMSSDQKFIARWDYEDGRIRLLDGTTEKDLFPAEINGGIDRMALSPDGKYLATSGSERSIHIWDVGTSRALKRLEGDPGNYLYFSSDASTLYSVGSYCISVWDVSTGKEQVPIRAGTNRIEWTPGGSRDGRTLAFRAGVFDKEATLNVFDTVAGKVSQVDAPARDIIATATNGKSIVTRQRDGSMYVIDIGHDRKEPRALAARMPGLFVALILSADGKTIGLADDNGDVRLVDAENGKEFRQLGEKLQRKEDPFGRRDRSGPPPLAFSPDGHFIASEGKDNKVILWETASGKQRSMFEGGHQAILTALAFTPDGKTLISASKEGVAVFWDLSKSSKEEGSGSPKPKTEPLPPGANLRIGSGRLVHSSQVQIVGFTPDSKCLVSTGSDGLVRFWDLATGLESLLIDPRNSLDSDSAEDILSVDVARNGKLLGVLVKGKGALLYDAARGAYVRKVGPADAARLAISADGGVLAMACKSKADRAIRLVEAATGKEVAKLEGHENIVNCLAFSSDGRLLLSGSDDLTVRIWDVRTGKEMRMLEGSHAPVFWATFSSDGRRVAALSTNFEVCVWDAATGVQAWRAATLHNLFVDYDTEGLARYRATKSLQFSPGGELLSASMIDGVHEWDAATGKVLRVPKPTGTGRLYVVSPDGKYLARCWSRGNPGSVELLDRETEKNLFPAESTSCRSLAVSPDGNCLATGSAFGDIRLWDSRTGNPVRRYEGHTGPVNYLFFAGNKSLISASGIYGDRTISRWNVETGKEESLLHTAGNVSGVALSRDGRTLLWMEEVHFPRDETLLHIFDLEKRNEIGQVSNKNRRTRALALSPDGKTYVTQAEGDAFILGTIGLGKEPRPLYQQSHALPYFGPDGRTVALADEDGAVRLVSVDSGHVVRMLDEKRHPDPKSRQREGVFPLVAFSSDGRMLATADDDGPILIWEIATGKQRTAFKGANQPNLSALAFTPDGKRLISASHEGQVIFWDVGDTTAEERQRAAKLTADEMEALWKELFGDDAGKAYQAIRVLRAAKASVPFVKEHLQPAVAVDPKKLDGWIADLDSSDFDERSKATKELEKLGGLAEAALRRTLAAKPSLETAKRIDEILQKLETRILSGEDLRACRAIEVLEHISTDAAKKLLEKFAAGADGASLTREAKVAIERWRASPKK